MATPEQRRELIGAIDALAKRGGITRDRAITAWYAHALLGVDEDDAIDAASVDGPEDAGCDFIFADDDAERVYVLQGYVSDRSDRPASVRKWAALTSAVANVKDPISFLHAGRPDIYDRLNNGDVAGYAFVFGLISLAAKSDQVSRQYQASVRSKAYGADVGFIYEHQESLYEQFLVAKAADRNVPKDSILFTGAPVALRGDFGQALIGSVKAQELVRLHRAYGNRLFEGNVRLFIGARKGGINERIIETASQRPGDFFALNNGVTLVADNFEMVTDQKCQLTQFSIVNGCQTTASLSLAMEKAGDAGLSEVLVRVVGAKRSLLTDIVRYNNTQNPVRLSAVRLLDPMQEALRNAFATIGYSYAPKQEGAKIVRSQKRIDLEKITQYLASFSDETVLEAVGRKGELFDRLYTTVFAKGLKAELVFLSWLLAQAVEERRVELLANTGDDQAMRTILGINGTPWAIYVANYLVQVSGSDLSKFNLKGMSSDQFKSAVSRYANKALELYAEIAINIVTSEEDGVSPRNVIRAKPFLEKLKRTLIIRKAKFSEWRLQKLHLVL